MAMTLNAPPLSPSSSSDSSILPRSPISPNAQAHSLPSEQPANSVPSTQSSSAAATTANGQMKRKPSRRANTAERRATHNAVERQRRETLNGRFLDLAALLPNLSQIRRPSKSSIVNSSIAHINASRRHRALASRELRALKLESDALRRELNEWRDRSNLPRVEEPVRGDGFNMVLSGELEVLAAVVEDEDEAAQGQQGYDGFDEADDDYPVMSDADDAARLAAVAMMKNAPSAAFLPQLLARPAHGPMIANTPPNVSFENPAMASLYEAAPFEYLQSQPQTPAQPDVEKWSAQLYQQQQQPRAFLTPPASAHALSGPSSASGTPPQNPFMDPSNQAFFTNYQRQQQHLSVLQQQQQQMERLFGSPERDDASSISSSGGRTHERSGSVGSGGYGTPPLTSPTDYDFGSASITDFGVRRISTGGLHVSVPGARPSWRHPGDASTADSTMGMMAQNIGLPISVGGGGNSNGFLMRMV